MTYVEIQNEIHLCEKKIRVLIDEIGSENDFDTNRVKFEEMKSLAKRVSELENLRKQMRMDEMKKLSEQLKKAMKEHMERLGN